jgi:hypothetical protein
MLILRYVYMNKYSMYFFRLLILLPVLFLLNVSVNAQSLFINEIMSSNGKTIADEDGHFEDWIELYNDGNVDIQMTHFSITDDMNRPRKWVFPSVVIPSKGFLLIFASGKNRLSGPYLHTNFSIKADGEPLFLFNSSLQLVDSITEFPIPRDQSLGRISDGHPLKQLFLQPTPGYSNTESTDGEIVHITANISSGFYPNPFYVSLIPRKGEDIQIYYTIDGTLPTSDKSLLLDSIYIYDRSTDPDILSVIPTNPDSILPYLRWQPPSGPVYKGTTLLARPFKDGEPVGPVVHYTYFISPDTCKKYTLPVISLITDPGAFFDHDTGIYIPGMVHEKNPHFHWWSGTGNYHQRGDNWERHAYITMMDTGGNVVLNQRAGVRIHGFATRSLPVKSLRLYARNEYGHHRFPYSFFGNGFDQYRRIILRNSGNDFDQMYFRDAITQEIIKDMNIYRQEYQPVILFINGEYWGIHNIRDRIDKHFVHYLTGDDGDNIDLINYNNSPTDVVEEGSYEFYQTQIESFIQLHASDLNHPQVYQHLASVIDFDNYIDYYISKMYFAIYDWPGNNVRFWREKTPNSKFRWISFDNDDALLRHSLNSMLHVTRENGPHWPNPDFSTHLFRHLIQITRFKDSFISKFEYHMLNTFRQEKIDSILHVFKTRLEPEIEEHINRWNYPKNKGHWESYIHEFRENSRRRRCFIRQMLIDFFQMTDLNYMVDVCDTATRIMDVSPDQQWEKNIQIFPMPNHTGEVNVSLHSANSHLLIRKIQICDMLGRQILSFDESSWSKHSQQVITLPKIHLKGVFMMKIDTGSVIISKKILLM